MSKKKSSDTIRQQRHAREEFLKLKKMQQGELAPEPKPSEVYAAPLSFSDKIKNLWYHNKLAIIIITLLVIVIAALIAQCATKTKYDATVVVFTYEITGNVNCDKMGEYLKPYCKDINDDGEVNVNVINCSIDGKNDNNDYNFTRRQTAQSLIATDGSALLFITDDDSYNYLMGLSEKVPLFENEPFEFDEDFYEFCIDDSGFYDLPRELQISCRTVKDTAIENTKDVDMHYDQAKSILKELEKAKNK